MRIVTGWIILTRHDMLGDEGPRTLANILMLCWQGEIHKNSPFRPARV